MTRGRTGELALLLALTACPDRPPPPEDPRLASIVQKKGRAFTVPLQGAEWVHDGDHVDVVLTLQDPQTGEMITLTGLQNAIVIDVSPVLASVHDAPPLRPITLLAQPEEAEILLEGLHSGTGTVAVRNREDIDIQEERGRATLTTLLTGERLNTLLKKRLALTAPPPGAR